MPPTIQRILFECTQIHQTRGTTGIPRVVRSLATYGIDAAREHGVELVPVIVRDQRLYRVAVAPPHIETRPTLGTWTRRVVECGLGRERANQLSAALQRGSTRLRKLLVPRTLVRPVVKLWHRYRAVEVVVQPTDVLLLTGSSWSIAAHAAVKLAARVGIPLGVIIHDLIPLDHPEFFLPQGVADFREWMEQVTAVCDVFLSVSQATRERLWQDVHQRQPQRVWSPAQFPSFLQGADMAPHEDRPIRCPGLTKVFRAGRPGGTYLTVSTIEPRKNHAFLLDAFEHLWPAHPDARLCIVGRIGWLCDELVARITRHPRYGRQLFMFNDLSDGELDYCYRQAKAFLFASKAEGFGLPIVEALCHGLPVLASDIPVHREVGGAYCGYFDLAEPRRLADWISHLEQTGRLPGVAPPQGYRAVDWSASSRDFIRQILRALASRQNLPEQHRMAA